MDFFIIILYKFRASISVLFLSFIGYCMQYGDVIEYRMCKFSGKYFLILRKGLEHPEAGHETSLLQTLMERNTAHKPRRFLDA